ncbi:MAG TPA: hypothetical protein VF765_31075 [Polyangiaceae bacterium]
MAVSPLPLTAPDLVCLEDLDPFGGETTSDLQSLWQDVYHILVETPCSNPDDPDRGVGLPKLLSGAVGDLVRICHVIDAQLKKDDRIDGAKSTLEQLPPGSALPDGTPLPEGGYLLTVELVAGDQVLGNQFSFTNAEGLAPT